MLNPHLVTAVFYLTLTLVATVGSALISGGLVPAFGAAGWIRVHFVTLGVITQVLFAALPSLVAERVGKALPRTRWGTWLTYNAGLLALLVGIPLANTAMIVVGGTLVLVAVLALMWELRTLARGGNASCGISNRFYGVGLLYLLLGGFIGTGLWLGWSSWLALPAPKEVHVHSNLWGFGSLMLGGLLLELRSRLAPAEARRPARWPTGAFILMVVGAMGLVLGPWLNIRILDTVGVVIHTGGTLLLQAGVARALRAAGKLRTPGSLQLLTPYVWQMVAVLMAPIVVFARGSEAGGAIAGLGSLVLIYGWLLAFSLALLPYLLERRVRGREAKLGGSWLSLGAGHLGAVLWAASLFLVEYRSLLQALAFVSWAIAVLPIVLQSWRAVNAATSRLEEVDSRVVHGSEPSEQRAVSEP